MKSNKNDGTRLYFSQFGGERSIPEQFLAAMDRAEERTKVPKDAVLPSLSDEIVEARFDTRYENTNDKQLVVIKKKKGRIGPLLDFRTTSEGLSVQVAATMFRTADATFVRAIPSSTQDVAIKDLGNGWSIQEVAISGTYVGGIFAPSPFARDSYAKERLNLIPEKFRGLIPTLRTKVVTDGQAIIPTLGAGELYRSEEDLTAFRKLVEVLTINDITFPVDIIDTAVITEYGGGPVNINQRLAVVNTLTVEQGEDVVSSKVTKIGEGHELRDTTRRQANAWPVEYEDKFDPRLQVIIPSTRQVVGLGTTSPGISGAVVTERLPVDGYRETKVITTQPLSAADAYVRILHNNTNVSVPPELVSIQAYYSQDGGAGTYTENGNYTISAPGVGGLQLRGSAQASASVVPEASWIVKIPRTQNIPCRHILLYVSNTATRAQVLTAVNVALGSPGLSEWPTFRPQQVLLLLQGGKVNGRLEISATAHDSLALDFAGVVKYSGNSRTNGGGLSVDVSRTSRLVQLPETIHPTISSIGGNGPSSSAGPYYATGSIICGVASSQPIGGAAIAGGSVEIISGGEGTTGTQTIPASGEFLHRLVTEPDSLVNRVRVFAEVVNFSDIYVA